MTPEDQEQLGIGARVYIGRQVGCSLGGPAVVIGHFGTEVQVELSGGEVGWLPADSPRLRLLGSPEEEELKTWVVYLDAGGQAHAMWCLSEEAALATLLLLAKWPGIDTATLRIEYGRNAEEAKEGLAEA